MYLCLLMIAMLCLIGGAALSVSGVNGQIVYNGVKKIQAFYAAEAGRELVLAELKCDCMWRGDEDPFPFSRRGELSPGDAAAGYVATVSDCTDDGWGIYNSLIPAGHILVTSVGTYFDATQQVACLIKIAPETGTPALFPKKAVITSGSGSGSWVGLNNYGNENSSLLQFDTSLPEANSDALTAMADAVFSSLDNNTYAEYRSEIDSFWQDYPADTRPHIVCVEGDLNISGDKSLYGIIYIEGEQVVLSGKVKVHGVIYAPNAKNVTIENGNTPGAPVVTGQLIAGPGGVQATGNPVIVQLYNDYIDAFNDVAGPEVEVSMVPGSWTSF